MKLFRKVRLAHKRIQEARDEFNEVARIAERASQRAREVLGQYDETSKRSDEISKRTKELLKKAP